MPVSATVKRWYNLKMNSEDLVKYVLSLQLKFRKYRENIFNL
jgi:hypothetical protein